VQKTQDIADFYIITPVHFAF